MQKLLKTVIGMWCFSRSGFKGSRLRSGELRRGRQGSKVQGLSISDFGFWISELSGMGLGEWRIQHWVS
jgi:hypothetical protein